MTPNLRLRIALAAMGAFACGLALAGCWRAPAGCETTGPVRLLPERVLRIRLGMSKRDVQTLIGQAAYSPIEGQYYHPTGGKCPLEATGRTAPCGVIADFRKPPDFRVTDELQSCTWGAIGE
jgi:hypothetical protein